MGSRKGKTYGSDPDTGCHHTLINQSEHILIPSVPELNNSFQRSLVPVLTIIMLVIMAGEAMLTAALPIINDEFSVPGVFESWVLPMVFLIGAAAAPFIGTAGDLYGRRKILLICLFLYLSGLICGYLAQNIWILLLSRGMQGIGIASFPLAYALVRSQLSNRDADIGIGIISATYGAGTFIGVIAGSIIIDYYNWHMTYVPLIPITVFLILITMRYIHEFRPVRNISESGYHLDWFGLFSLVATLLLSLTVLSFQDLGNEGEYIRIIFLLSAMFTAFLFIRHELSSPYPLADLHLVWQKPVILLIAIGSLTILTFLMFLQEMPFLIQSDTGLGLDIASVGLILMPGTLCDMIAGPITGRLVVSRGVQPACILGSLFLFTSTLTLMPGIPSVIVLTGAWMLFSAGMSMTSTACIIAMIDYVPRSRTAEATGLMQSVQTIGGMVGPVITGIILASSVISSPESGTIPATITFIITHYTLFLVSTLILCLSLLFNTCRTINVKDMSVENV